MIVGFLVDKGDHSTPSQQKWASGEPERSFWSGLKLKGKDVLPVTTYRCIGCGYLESYAGDATA